MTKSTITRERLEWLSQISCRDDIEDIGGDEIRELASIALAAMDSEPVFTLEVSQADYKGQKLGNHFGFITLDAARKLKEGNYQLYRHAQPAPVVPDELPLHAIAPYSGAEYEAGYRDGWNACRAAMLAADPQEVKGE
ncbi:TPA: hypothetical protein ACNVCB_002832 [Klebsiella pneumoniae]